MHPQWGRRGRRRRVCRWRRAKLLIAKLDRLARNVAFTSNLMESGVEFVAVQFSHANRLTMHILEAVAEHEREMIAKRTRDALQAANARGARLGLANPARGDQRAVSAKGTAAVAAEADRHAANVLPVVRSVQMAGVTTLCGVADALNARGIATARGGTWHATTVRNLIQRGGAAWRTRGALPVAQAPHVAR